MTDPSPHHPPDPSSAGDSSRAIAGQFLRFMGLLTTCGGALAILRTGERSVLFAVMMPLGLVVWGAGMWLRRKEARHG